MLMMLLLDYLTVSNWNSHIVLWPTFSLMYNPMTEILSLVCVAQWPKFFPMYVWACAAFVYPRASASVCAWSHTCLVRLCALNTIASAFQFCHNLVLNSERMSFASPPPQHDRVIFRSHRKRAAHNRITGCLTNKACQWHGNAPYQIACDVL